MDELEVEKLYFKMNVDLLGVMTSELQEFQEMFPVYKRRIERESNREILREIKNQLRTEGEALQELYAEALADKEAEGEGGEEEDEESEWTRKRFSCSPTLGFSIHS